VHVIACVCVCVRLSLCVYAQLCVRVRGCVQLAGTDPEHPVTGADEVYGHVARYFFRPAHRNYLVHTHWQSAAPSTVTDTHTYTHTHTHTHTHTEA
jgi:hypothetical protein